MQDLQVAGSRTVSPCGTMTTHLQQTQHEVLLSVSFRLFTIAVMQAANHQGMSKDELPISNCVDTEYADSPNADAEYAEKMNGHVSFLEMLRATQAPSCIALCTTPIASC